MKQCKSSKPSLARENNSMIGWMAYFISLVALSQILLWGRITFPLTYFPSNFCLFYNSY